MDDRALRLAKVEGDRGRPERAEEILRDALAQATEQCGEVAVRLGVLREQRGDLAGAELAYEIAVASDDRAAAGFAALNLGLIRGKQGDLSEAERLMRIAVGCGDATIRVPAAINLGSVLARYGAIGEARYHFQQVITTRHRLYAPQAKRLLAQLG